MQKSVESSRTSRARGLDGARQILVGMIVVITALLAFMAVHHSDTGATNDSAGLTEIVHISENADGSQATTSSPGSVLLTGCAIFVLCCVVALTVLLAIRGAARTLPGVFRHLRPSLLAFLASSLPQPPSLTLLSISRT